MTESNAEMLNRIFHALADPTRRAMVRRLASGEHTVTELAEPYRMSLAAASKHIKVLEEAGLLKRTVKGRTHLCRLDSRALAAAQAWIGFYERFWSDQLDALELELQRQERASTGEEERG